LAGMCLDLFGQCYQRNRYPLSWDIIHVFTDASRSPYE